jgi:hypothetical protein
MLAAQEIFVKHFGRVNTAHMADLLWPSLCPGKKK